MENVTCRECMYCEEPMEKLTKFNEVSVMFCAYGGSHGGFERNVITFTRCMNFVPKPVKKTCRECKWIENITESKDFTYYSCIKKRIKSLSRFYPLNDPDYNHDWTCFTPKEDTMTTLTKDGKTYEPLKPISLKAVAQRRPCDDEFDAICRNFQAAVEDPVIEARYQFSEEIPPTQENFDRLTASQAAYLVDAGFLVEVEGRTFKVWSWFEVSQHGNAKKKVLVARGDGSQIVPLLYEGGEFRNWGDPSAVNNPLAIKMGELDSALKGPIQDTWKKITPPTITFPDDEADCGICKGKGGYHDGVRVVSCVKCNGTGKVPK